MPNHVHAAVALQPSWTVARVVQTWKSYSAHEINRRLGRVGRLWKPDFFDLRIRDDEHLSRVRRYIERNPVVAGLCRTPADWPLGSAARLRSDGESGR